MIHEKDAGDSPRRPSRGEGPGRERSASPGAVPLRRTPLRRSPGGEEGAGGPAPSLPARRPSEAEREPEREAEHRAAGDGGLWRLEAVVVALVLAGVLLFVLGFLTALVLTGALFGPHA